MAREALSLTASSGAAPAAIGDVTADIARDVPVRDRGPAAAASASPRRRRWRIWLPAVAVVATAAFTGLYLGLSPDGPPKRTAGPSASHTVTSPRPTPTPTRTPTPTPTLTPTAMDFREIGSTGDTTFNQLLAINGEGVIAGYFGPGAMGHPNKGYVIKPPYRQRDFISENYPGSVQTQVTGLNDAGVQVGFYSTQNTASLANNNFGFYFNGSFHKVVFPTGNNAKPPVDQLLGVNDHGIAVGFYSNSAGLARGYEFNTNSHHFSLVTKPGAPTGGKAPSLTAAAINNRGDVAGFYTTTGGTVDAFLKRGGSFTTIAVPGAAATDAFGVNDNDTVVGTYTDGTGAAATTHGFIWKVGGHLTTVVDDPNGAGTTFLNGINDEGDIVGFYTDSAGNTDGLVASPKS
jgi:hypothetical protein